MHVHSEGHAKEDAGADEDGFPAREVYAVAQDGPVAHFHTPVGRQLLAAERHFGLAIRHGLEGDARRAVGSGGHIGGAHHAGVFDVHVIQPIAVEALSVLVEVGRRPGLVCRTHRADVNVTSHGHCNHEWYEDQKSALEVLWWESDARGSIGHGSS